MDNAELSYLLGMIAGKGTIIRGNDRTEIIIDIPHKNLISEGMDAGLSVKASLDDMRNIVEPLIGVRLLSSQTRYKTTLKFTKDNQDFLIREINRYFGRLSSCKDFRIPVAVFDFSTDLKRQFMIGLSDVTAHIRSSNLAFGLTYHHRAYIEIPVNWFMVADIGNLLYSIDVPIHTIDWAHPNMRDPNLRYYHQGKQEAWFKEHQIKIFADEFERVGFNIVHKQKALQELASKNRVAWDLDIQRKIERAKTNDAKMRLSSMLGRIDLSHHKYYWQTKTVSKVKPAHPMENSDKIPEIIRGRHFDSWKDICIALGYREERNHA